MNKPLLTRISQVAVPLALFSFMLWYPTFTDDLRRVWIVSLVLLVIFCGAIGQWLMHSVWGMLISSFNLLSLSRIQMTAWTVVILSGYFVILMARLKHGAGLNGIPLNLLAALGISTASFAAVPIVLDAKSDATVDPQEIRAAGAAFNENAGAIAQNAKGSVYANSQPSEARFSDLFQGDEIGNTAYVDISKVQLFLLTVFVLTAYCYDLWQKIGGVSGNGFAALEMPDFSGDELKLLALSHAGYLTFKAVNHTQAAPAPAAK